MGTQFPPFFRVQFVKLLKILKIQNLFANIDGLRFNLDKNETLGSKIFGKILLKIHKKFWFPEEKLLFPTMGSPTEINVTSIWALPK